MIKLRSFAKINLGLEISGKRPDGYHSLRTVFQTIDLYDTIEIRKNRSRKVRLSGSDPSVPWDQTNTISRVIARVYNQFSLQQGLDIFVFKRIPSGSGLGGGSGNAAVMLLFLNEFFQLGMDLERLREIAQEVGTDVPFFFIGWNRAGGGPGRNSDPAGRSASAVAGLAIDRNQGLDRAGFFQTKLDKQAVSG